MTWPASPRLAERFVLEPRGDRIGRHYGRLAPPTISAHRVVDPLMPELADRLRQYNRRASEVVRIQLRVALHVGPVGKDAEGLTGPTVILSLIHI